MLQHSEGLRSVLCEPEFISGLDLGSWDVLVRRARRAGLLAVVAYRAAELGLLSSVPAAPRRHLEGSLALAEAHARSARWEVNCIESALSSLGVSLIFLKGAAYLLANLKPSTGRLFGDIDLMVPKAHLPEVEKALLLAGWRRGQLDTHDERYYRSWMHEIPPMTHFIRGSTIDVHHTIVPRTARIRLDPEKLFAAAVPLKRPAGTRILAPADLVLHSSAHLFNEGEFDRGLRDLYDLNLLLRYFGTSSDFWSALLERAAELDLRRPLYYALRYSAMLLRTPVPMSALRVRWPASPNVALRTLMDILFQRALQPNDPDCTDWFTNPALFLLYIRSHHLKLPAHLLIPHLIRKAYMRRFKKDD